MAGVDIIDWIYGILKDSATDNYCCTSLYTGKDTKNKRPIFCFFVDPDQETKGLEASIKFNKELFFRKTQMRFVLEIRKGKPEDCKDIKLEECLYDRYDKSNEVDTEE